MSTKDTPTFARRIANLFYDVNQKQLSAFMHRTDVMHQYSLDALRTMMDAKEMMSDVKLIVELSKQHDCGMCNTRHVDGEPCDADSCEHDYDSSKGDDGWMVCIYCHDEQPDDYDGDDY